MHDAALQNNSTGALQLIAAGAVVDAPDYLQFTPLHFAAQEFSVEVATILLDAGAQVNARNVYGNNPLFTAVFNSRGRGELVQLLLSRGADAAAVNNAGQSPIGLARLIGNYDVLQFFEDER
ncbi:ankyrin repeat domain-containing protein [Curtobacterium sp. ISL-83]|nr:ankyrin repeat domain-containing protein [Curtobacterium sp. ISL-83]